MSSKKGNRKLTVIILVLLAIAIFFRTLINFVTDLLWFYEIGYESVFLIKLFTQLKIGVPTFIILGALSYIFLMVIEKEYLKREKSPVIDKNAEKFFKKIALGLSAALAGLAALIIASATWFEVLKFSNSTDFGIADPLFNLDISFYVFRLELIEQLNKIAIGIMIGLAVIAFMYYSLLTSFNKPRIAHAAVTGDDFDDEDDYEDDYDDESEDSEERQGGGIIETLVQILMGGESDDARRMPDIKKYFGDNSKKLFNIASMHIIVLGVIVFLMVGINFFLKQFQLLYSSSGVLYGAGYTDVNVTLMVYRILIGLSVLSAIGFAVGVRGKNFKIMLAGPVAMIAFWILGNTAAFLVQNYIVSADEINMEREFLARNIEFTQHAYDLNNVTIRDFPVTNTLTRDDIENNMETISNIRINDYEPVRRFYNNVQTIRPYYVFTDVYVDRYLINGEYTQVYIAAREIDDTARSPIPQTFLNRHIKYTHGYGITLSRVDRISSSGLPEMLIRNIPPQSDVEEITISRPQGRPEIYFGRMTNDFILVNTTEPAFDYPIGGGDGGGNAEVARYEGDAGIKLSLVNRLLFAIRENNPRILISGALTGESRILINRNVMRRIQTIMPRLSYDTEPYMVTVDGRLFWIIDAYTTSGRYPYSEPLDRRGPVNYIRNSVKIVVDAYNGTANFYNIDAGDPIAAAYKKIFPALFKDFDRIDEMSPQLRNHIRYPNLLLNYQANMYRRYHMTDVTMFYQNEDLWDISTEIFGTSEQQMIPNYYIMKLPGEQSAEFVNTLPFTPRNRRNMSALLVARNDGASYGELVLYQLPKGRQIPGPMQVDAQIEQDGQIAQDLALWSQSGSLVNRGNMFVVPIENSLLYIKPIYLEAETGSIPEVRRVIVAHGVPGGDGVRISYRATLREALEELFGSPPAEETVTEIADIAPRSSATVSPPATEEGAAAELTRLAAEAFENAQTAQRLGNWAAYGRYLSELELYLNELEAIFNPRQE